MEQVAYDYSQHETEHKDKIVTKTTLYDLIKAINDDLPEEEDHVVTEIILDLLDKERIRLLNHNAELAIYW